MTMPAKEAAKVLRGYQSWRRGIIDKWEPESPAELGHAIDAAVAALESTDTITERARELIGLHMSEQEGMMIPTAQQFQDAIDALAQAIGAPEQSPPCANSRQPAADSRHPRERVLAQDAARGNFRHPRHNNDHQNDGA